MYTIDGTQGLCAVAGTAREAVGILGRHIAAHQRTDDITYLIRDCDSDRWAAGTMLTQHGPVLSFDEFLNDGLRRILRYLIEPDDDARLY